MHCCTFRNIHPYCFHYRIHCNFFLRMRVCKCVCADCCSNTTGFSWSTKCFMFFIYSFFQFHAKTAMRYQSLHWFVWFVFSDTHKKPHHANTFTNNSCSNNNCNYVYMQWGDIFVLKTKSKPWPLHELTSIKINLCCFGLQRKVER